MADVPEVIGYGEVKGRFVSFRADGTDVGDVPDEIPLSGTVTLTPTVNLMRWPTLDPPRIAAISPIVARVVSGDLQSPEGTGGLFVVATDQPLGEPNRVQWKATFNLAAASAQPPSVTFDVPADAVVDLTTVIPASPQPGTVTVVSSEDRIAAEQARDEAEAARDAAVQVQDDLTEQAIVDGLTWSGAVDLTTLADAPRMLDVTLTGDVTLTLPPVADKAYTVSMLLTQDATGGHVLTVNGRTAFGVPVALSESGTDLVHLLAAPGGWVVLMGAQGIEVPA